ncbi:MAG: TRAP transporter small permease subunit [Lachnospiraceae bacterium]|nr:TRAP transporter small permease subunit [Candidatus Minthocola equi]
MKVLKWLDKYAEKIYLCVALVVITVVLMTQIILRKVFGVALGWPEELCRHLFIGMGIWGIATTIRDDSAIKFDLIIGFLPPIFKSIFGVISNVIMAVFFSYLLVPAYNTYVSQKTTSATTMPYMMSLVFGFCFIGIILIVIRTVQMIILNTADIVKRAKSKGEKTE